MANSHAEIFSSLRIPVLDTLVESRHSIDDAFASLSDAMIRQQFEAVFEQMLHYLGQRSPEQLNQAVSGWSAALLGLGLSPRSVLRTVVTIGDLIVQVAEQTLPASPSTNLFVREIARMNFGSAREIVRMFQREAEAVHSALRKPASGEGPHGR